MVEQELCFKSHCITSFFFQQIQALIIIRQSTTKTPLAQMLCIDAGAGTLNHDYHDKYGVRVILGVENNPYTAHPYL